MAKKVRRKRGTGIAASQTAGVEGDFLEQKESVEQVDHVTSAKKGKKRKRAIAKPTEGKSCATTPNVSIASSTSVAMGAHHLPFSGTTKPDDWTALVAKLCKGGAILEAVEVQHAGLVHGHGVFARRDIDVGEVVFALVANQALTPELAEQDEVVSRVGKVLRNGGEHVTKELLMCLRLCRARVCAQDTLHPYVASLAPIAPGVACWPEAFRRFLSSTNIGRNLLAVDAELDAWVKLLQQVAEAEPLLLTPKGAFERPCLEWAHGMLHSRQVPLCQNGTAMCMVPLVDLLSHKAGAALELRVGTAGRLEAISTATVKAGQQLHRDFGKLNNTELLLRYGFAIEDNKWECFPLMLADDTDNTRVIHVTADGVPQDVIDVVEAEQDTQQFIAILRSVLLQSRAVKEHIRRLPVALNYNVCKGPLSRARKRWIEAFLEGQLHVLEGCLETMQTAEEDAEASEAAEAVEEAEDSEADGESVDEAEMLEMLHKKKRRRTRRRG